MNDGGFRCDDHSLLSLGWRSHLLTGLFLFIGIVGMSGCAGLHIYSAENDSEAAAAKKASDAISLKDTISDERKNQDKLLSHELEVVAQFSLTRRNTALRALLEDKNETDGSPTFEPLSTKLKRRIVDRLTKLTNADPLEVLDKLDDVKTNFEKLGIVADDFTQQLVESLPICEVGLEKQFTITGEMKERYKKTAEKKGKQTNLDNLLNNYQHICNEYQKSWKVFASSGGEITKIVKDEQQAKANLAEKEKAAKKEKHVYEASLDKYTSALKTSQNNSEVSNQLKKDAQEAQKHFESLSKAGSFLGLEAVNTKIDQIDLILTAVGQGKVNEDNLQNVDEKTKQETLRALAVAADFPEFADQISTIAVLNKLPPVNVLLFEKERLLALKEDAEKSVSREQSRVSLLKNKMDASISEIKGLADADQHVNWAIKANGGKSIDTESLYEKPIKESARRHMVMALASYLNTFTGPRRILHEDEYRLIDIEHSKILDASETALKLWEVAIKQPVNIEADFHKSGIKKEDIIELLKAAGFFSIAAGVN